MDFISNIISNSVAGFVEAGTRTAGGYAGDALIRAGDFIESAGQGIGTSVENAATSYASKVAGQGVVATKANLPKSQTPKTKAITSGKTSGTRPTTLQRSYSSPAPSQSKKTPVTAIKGASTSTGKQVTPKKPTPFLSTSTSTSTNTSKPDSSLPKPYPGTTTYPSKVDAPKPKPYPGTTTYPSKVDAPKPKPYPGTTTYPSKADSSKPKPYLSTTSNPSKTGALGPSDSKPYPGTTIYPNSGKKTAVKPAKKAPIPAKAPTKPEGTFNHIQLK
ncbi:hypothetical protein AOQ84DRAFT_111211 [Glonium stellatum]|uniref:Uncharacterized protein n=1 Tax=Glonium stellatum TaxID=574774 RepID=A0A8E2JY11_9PEZI|nr:hypothetical protein AOQ84DRAFT_111211 [Glonium stellatum]